MHAGESSKNQLSNSDDFDILSNEPFAGALQKEKEGASTEEIAAQKEEELSLSAEEIVEHLIKERHRPPDVRRLYPEVYDAEYEDISPKCRAVAESFERADFYDLIDAYDTDFRLGNNRLAGYLTKLLGLKSRPQIVYEGETGNTAGQYRTDSNTIAFFCGPDGPKGSYADYVQIIAHEMWHAYQEQHSQEGGTPRSELYDANARHYIRHQEDKEGYYSQLLEREALWFGRHLKYGMERASHDKEGFFAKIHRFATTFDSRHGFKS